MVRIKIEDLPVLEELTQEEMASIFGGSRLGMEGEDEGEIIRIGTGN